MSEPRYRRSEEFVVRALGPRQVLVPVRARIPHDVLLFLLDGPVALRLWELLAEARSARELEAAVLAEFDAPGEVVAAELEVYLRQLLGLGAVTLLDATPPGE